MIQQRFPVVVQQHIFGEIGRNPRSDHQKHAIEVEVENALVRTYRQLADGDSVFETTAEDNRFLKWPRTVIEARNWIDDENPELSIRKQCRFLGLHRSNLYYDPVLESAGNLQLMRLMDEGYLCRSHRGSRQMVDNLQDQGLVVNRNRIQRLMRKMGIEGIAPKPRTTQANPSNPVYPYLLRNLEIVRPNQVWCSDITYIPMEFGFLYLVAVMDCTAVM